MLFVVHAVDKTDMLPTRAKFYRAHRIHLDDAANYDVDVVTAGTLVADDGSRSTGPPSARASPYDASAKHAAAARTIICIGCLLDRRPEPAMLMSHATHHGF